MTMLATQMLKEDEDEDEGEGEGEGEDEDEDEDEFSSNAISLKGNLVQYSSVQFTLGSAW